MKLPQLKTFIACSLILIGFTQMTTVVSASEVETRFEKTYLKSKKINSTIRQRLFKDQESKNDSDNNKSWSKFIKGINYLKNDQLEIYVNDNFKKLKDDDRQEILYQAQLFALRIADKYKDVSETSYIDGLDLKIFCDGSFLGRSEFLNHRGFTWKK